MFGAGERDCLRVGDDGVIARRQLDRAFVVMFAVDFGFVGELPRRSAVGGEGCLLYTSDAADE